MDAVSGGCCPSGCEASLAMLKCLCILAAALLTVPCFAPGQVVDAMRADNDVRIDAPATLAPIDRAQGGKSTLEKIEESSLLRVGIALNAPWVMHDAHGAPIGYSIDVARRFAASMGWKVRFVESTWARLLPGLRADQFDVVISGLAITPQRARYVQFTDPIREFDVTIMVNRGRLPRAGLAELRKIAHAKVAARKDQVTVEFARNALPDADILEIDDEEAAIAELRAGKIDAYVAEVPLLHLLEKAHPTQLRVLDNDPITRTAHGFAVRRGDAELRRILEAWIVYESASGWLKERGRHWFEDTDWVKSL